MKIETVLISLMLNLAECSHACSVIPHCSIVGFLPLPMPFALQACDIFRAVQVIGLPSSVSLQREHDQEFRIMVQSWINGMSVSACCAFSGCEKVRWNN